jgi:hypothetical protein
MSDEHAKKVGTRPEYDIKWGTPEKITAFFCVNLLAAYVPALVCVTDLPKVSPALVYLCSPVVFAGIATSYATNDAGGWFFLAALILLLFLASAALHNSRTAWVAIPSLVFVYSLLQGMLAVAVINALGGIGH